MEQDEIKKEHEAVMQNVDGTPFTSIKVGDKYFLALGKYRLTEPVYKSHRDVIKKANQVDYLTVMQIVSIMIETIVPEIIKKNEEFKPE